MDSLSSIMPLITQLVSQLTARDNGRKSNAEMEVMVRSVVNECLQQQAATERREMVSSLMEVVKESVTRPAETRRDPEVDDLLKKFKELNAGKEKQQSERDQGRTNKQMIMEVLQELLNDNKLGQGSSRSSARESTNNKDLVLPWCDGPDSDSKSKFAAKGKQFSEKKSSINDARNKNFNKDRGEFEKKSFDGHKNFNRGRGGFRGENRNNFPQDGARRDNRPREAAAGPVNVPQAGHVRATDQYQHQHQHWQQEGAVGYTRPDVPHYQGPMNNHMHQQQYGMVPPHARSYQPGPPNYNYHQSAPANYSYQHGPPNYNNQPSPANNSGSFPRQQFGNAGLPPLLSQPPPNNPHIRNNIQPSFRPVDATHGGNMNHGAADRTFTPRGNNTRGRGGYQRGGYNNRGGPTNRPDSRGNAPDTHRSLTDLTAGLSPEEVTTIKNVLKSDTSGIHSNKSNQNKVAFKPKKNNLPGKPNAEDSDDQEEEKANNLSTNENKVFEDKLPSEAASTGAKKKKKKTNKNVSPEEDEKPKEASADNSDAVANENVKLLVGLGINKGVLSNVNANQEVKHVVLIARCGDETKTLQPKTVGEFKEFMDKYPKAEAIIVKKE